MAGQESDRGHGAGRWEALGEWIGYDIMRQ